MGEFITRCGKRSVGHVSQTELAEVGCVRRYDYNMYARRPSPILCKYDITSSCMVHICLMFCLRTILPTFDTYSAPTYSVIHRFPIVCVYCPLGLVCAGRIFRFLGVLDHRVPWSPGKDAGMRSHAWDGAPFGLNFVSPLSEWGVWHVVWRMAMVLWGCLSVSYHVLHIFNGGATSNGFVSAWFVLCYRILRPDRL